MVYVVFDPGVTGIIPLVVPAGKVTTVPSFNVTSISPVPVNATLKSAVAPEHIVSSPLNVAVGGDTTEIVPIVLAKSVDAFVFSSVTLINL